MEKRHGWSRVGEGYRGLRAKEGIGGPERRRGIGDPGRRRGIGSSERRRGIGGFGRRWGISGARRRRGVGGPGWRWGISGAKRRRGVGGPGWRWGISGAKWRRGVGGPGWRWDRCDRCRREVCGHGRDSSAGRCVGSSKLGGRRVPLGGRGQRECGWCRGPSSYAVVNCSRGYVGVSSGWDVRRGSGVGRFSRREVPRGSGRSLIRHAERQAVADRWLEYRSSWAVVPVGQGVGDGC